MSSRTIRLDLEYDGTDFLGWQIQAHGRTVQGELARALRELLQEPVTPVGSGRTDAGTHALGQVAHFRTGTDLPPERICRALNSLLPADISIRSAAEAAADFHARYSAVSKRYRYRIATHKTAVERRWVWTFRRSLDFDLMAEAASSLAGTHDFRAFCNQHPVPDSFTCTVLDCGWERDGPEMRFEVEANRFLRHMVRIIVGTLVEIGLGKRVPNLSPSLRSDVEGNGERREVRRLAGPTAPARGLCLLAVNYPEESPPPLSMYS